MDKDKLVTIETYNRQAVAFAAKFDEQGPRQDDIEKIFKLCQKTNPYVLEIGCGNGRDAAQIILKTTNYLGIDVSGSLLNLAKEKVSIGRCGRI
ncbi:MAG: hypothetical protein A2589_01910 [Candidatus Vogelbacteria bacterium RIFOXYD1_FULL_46_19]|uniref:Methyltransferase domain-containing protein n=1 Tax=Candidatus Vogelbacteria bacterium RIFOXYD1_FULL_46_19 TaxID=1802439 RepID=A0A1G2QG49_9BACT|nr:MAG: hypothetical protein A2589_01910 [Candidatus Vogelbacteria bacterium RIFOXYD1_FULL_46_19]